MDRSVRTNRVLETSTTGAGLATGAWRLERTDQPPGGA